MRVGRHARGVAVLGLFALLVLPGPPADAQVPSPPGGPWQLTFEETFDGAALDGAKWVQYEGAQNSQDLNYFSPQDLSVGGGVLRLALQRRELGGKPYTSGGLGTHGKYNQAYGRWEVRAKAPRGQGLAPYVALWPDGPGASWPPEIDVFECPGQARFAVVTGDAAAPRTQELSAEVDCAADFHTYAVEWTPDALRWSVDGVEQGAITQDVPSAPAALAMGLTAGACDDPITGCPAEDTPLPAVFEVDHVRVWRLDDPSAPQPSAVFTAPAAVDPLTDITAALEDAGVAPASPGATPTAPDPAAAQPLPSPTPTPTPTPAPTATESATALPVLAATGLSGALTMALAGVSFLGGLALVLWGRSLPAG